MLRTKTLVTLNPKVVRQGIFFLSRRNVRSDIKWSANAVDLARTPKWRALEDHFVHGVAWEQTGIIDEVLYLRQTKERVTAVHEAVRVCFGATRRLTQSMRRSVTTGIDRMRAALLASRGTVMDVTTSSGTDGTACGWHSTSMLLR
jgi:hypothetical protein